MLKKKIFINTAFKTSSQIFVFLFDVILARTLFPEDFGLFGISVMIFEIAKLFTMRGFGMALIQHKNATDKHFSTIFWLNMYITIFIVFFIIFFRQDIADYFKMPQLPELLKWHILGLFIIGFEFLSGDYLFREAKFFQLGLSGIISVIGFGILSILFAKLGYGALSLVFGSLIRDLIRISICIYCAKKIHVIKYFFSGYRSFRELLHVGIGMTFQQFFGAITGNLDYFLVGKMSSVANLGYYTKAYKLMLMPVTQITRNISMVLLSVFSRIQDDHKSIIEKFLKASQLSSLVLFPAFTSFHNFSPALIFNIYGEKWMPTVAALKVLIIAGCIKSVTIYAGDALKAKGIVFRELLVHVLGALFILLAGIYAIARWQLVGIAYVIVIEECIVWILLMLIFSQTFGLSLFKYATSFIPAIGICISIIIINLIYGILFHHIPETNTIYMLFGILMNIGIFCTSLFIIKKHTLVNIELEQIQEKLTAVLTEIRVRIF